MSGFATSVRSEEYRARVSATTVLEPLAQGVSGVVILATLKREHGYTGSYSAVRRLLATLKRETPPAATVRLKPYFDAIEYVDSEPSPHLDYSGVVAYWIKRSPQIHQRKSLI